MTVFKFKPYLVKIQDATYSYTQVGNNPLPDRPEPTVNYIGCFKEMTHSGSIADWKSRIQNRVGATSGFVGRIAKSEVTDGAIIYEVKHIDTFAGPDLTTHQEHTGCFVANPGFTYPGSLPTDEAQNIAKIRFLQKCLNAQTALQSLVVAGEFGEALHMIRHPAQALYRGLFDYVRDVKTRRNRAKPSRKSAVVAQTWLEYVFGWAPLISDVKGGMEALRRLEHDGPSTQYVKGYGQYDEEGPSYPFFTEGGIYTRYDFARHRLTARAIYLGAVTTVPPNGCATLSQFGIDWRQVIPTAWELVPFSFLADYFSTIGAVLNANSFNQSSIAWWQQTIIQESKNSNAVLQVVANPTGDPKDIYTSSFSSPCSITNTFRLIYRSPGSGLIVPTIGFRMPHTDTKWLNMAALLAASRS